MTTTITAPTLNQAIKSGRVPYQTIFSAVLSTRLGTAARFLLDGEQIGFVKDPLKKVSTPTGEAFLYCLIVSIASEGAHTLRVENLDTTTTPTGIIREFTETPFSLQIDQRLTIVKGSELIAAFRAEADPLPQYLTPTEANALYRAAGLLTEADIPRTQATDAEVTAAIADYNKATTFTLNGPLTFVANEWNTLDIPQGLSLGKQGVASAWVVAFDFQYSNIPEQQYCGAGILSFVFNKVNAETEGTRLLVNTYNQADFYLYVKATSGVGAARILQIKPEININIPSNGKLDIVLKPLF
ncbi:hypothetical protein QT972_09690 [Microcoleus sp. herbarium7]|uniref:hypothetical protein n=1 Tax=Microcoleus sp. herbarium7 TaxID=3055435 RepID=UPI002FD1A90A